jgi:hypothetical protein
MLLKRKASGARNNVNKIVNYNAKIMYMYTSKTEGGP